MPPPGKITRERFLAWVERQPRGRFERIDGEIVAMAPEKVEHARAKHNAVNELARAIARAGVPCEALPDGVTVQVGDDTDYEPDALVNCGEPIDGSSTYAPNPVVVVEVASPSTSARDATFKLIDYFTVPSIQHYLLVSVRKKTLVHHRRTTDAIATSILRTGSLTLDPPGITIDVAALFPP